uniref:Uncharacterized protein n=1 Tax=Anguilla anguilla TaxID=7936 RepID=A0A0E9TEA9_ANGAN
MCRETNQPCLETSTNLVE